MKNKFQICHLGDTQPTAPQPVQNSNGLKTVLVVAGTLFAIGAGVYIYKKSKDSDSNDGDSDFTITAKRYLQGDGISKVPSEQVSLSSSNTYNASNYLKNYQTYIVPQALVSNVFLSRTSGKAKTKELIIVDKDFNGIITDKVPVSDIAGISPKYLVARLMASEGKYKGRVYEFFESTDDNVKKLKTMPPIQKIQKAT